jgi:hypothetical protein
LAEREVHTADPRPAALQKALEPLEAAQNFRALDAQDSVLQGALHRHEGLSRRRGARKVEAVDLHVRYSSGAGRFAG